MNEMLNHTLGSVRNNEFSFDKTKRISPLRGGRSPISKIGG